MDAGVNPLRALPPAQRLRIMTYLSLTWTGIFCAAAGAWAWFGHLVVGHMLVAAGLLITGWTFATASAIARKSATYRDHPRRDGTARYDDVWGG